MGTQAPDFNLPATPDQRLRLSELRGKPVVLVFYPADWSPVCGDELALFNEALPLIKPKQAQLPRQVWIAMPRGSHSPRIDYPPIRMVQMAGRAHLSGVEEHLCNEVKVRIYSPAKTVVDCFKHRNKIGLDVALEALKDAWRTRKASADDLWRYAQDCRVATVMRPYMEAVAHE